MASSLRLKIAKAFCNPCSAIRWMRRKLTTDRTAYWWNETTGRTRSYEHRISSKAKLRLYSDSHLCRLIATTAFEIDERKFITKYLKQGDTFFDIGANIGLFTVIAAKAVGNSGAIHAFEPCESTFNRLQDNINRNRLLNVKPNLVALSADSVPLKIYQSLDGFDAWNSAAGPLAGTSHKAVISRTTTLDCYIAQTKSKPSLVKIDVEGWETKVLEGGRQVLSQPDSPDLLIEFTEANCNAAGTAGSELFDNILDFGYKLYRLDGSLKLEEASRSDNFDYCNLFCTKSLNAAKQRLEPRTP